MALYEVRNLEELLTVALHLRLIGDVHMITKRNGKNCPFNDTQQTRGEGDECEWHVTLCNRITIDVLEKMEMVKIFPPRHTLDIVNNDVKGESCRHLWMKLVPYQEALLSSLPTDATLWVVMMILCMQCTNTLPPQQSFIHCGEVPCTDGKSRKSIILLPEVMCGPLFIFIDPEPQLTCMSNVLMPQFSF